MITFKSNEKLLFTIRKHWFVFVGEIALPVVLAFLPIALYILTLNIFDLSDLRLFGSYITLLHPSLIIFSYSLWLLLIWMRIYIIWTDYYLDSWFVTDHRIVDVEQKGFFSRDVSSIPFDRIQDVKIEIHGLISTYFNFGNIHVQSAGSSREFVINGVPNPYELKEKVTRERDRFIRARRSKE
jgi:uncharacterized membrane protein YdbT with pleckstrin-like domain